MDKNISHTEKELSLDEIRRISNSLGKFNNLLLSGGEPFLREDIVDICKIFYKENSVRYIHLPTNGFFTHTISRNLRTILQECPDASIVVGLPLDGFEQTHDMIKGVQGSFKKVIETANELSKLKKDFSNLRTYIITVINSYNSDEVVDLAKFIKENLPTWGLGPSPLRGMPYDEKISPPDYKTWIKSMEGISSYIDDRGIVCNDREAVRLKWYQDYIAKGTAYILKNNRMPFKCQAGNVIGVLDPNGDIKICELTGSVGNVRLTGYDFKKVWFSKEACRMREKTTDCACTHACFLWPSAELSLWAAIKYYFVSKMKKFSK